MSTTLFGIMESYIISSHVSEAKSPAISPAISSNVLSDAVLKQLEQLQSVPEYGSSDPGSESVCTGNVSCKMECQVSSLGIDDE